MERWAQWDMQTVATLVTSRIESQSPGTTSFFAEASLPNVISDSEQS